MCVVIFVVAGKCMRRFCAPASATARTGRGVWQPAVPPADAGVYVSPAPTVTTSEPGSPKRPSPEGTRAQPDKELEAKAARVWKS
jgi:hypothetical protein